jgi:hypothetical protein
VLFLGRTGTGTGTGRWGGEEREDERRTSVYKGRGRETGTDVKCWVVPNLMRAITITGPGMSPSTSWWWMSTVEWGCSLRGVSVSLPSSIDVSLQINKQTFLFQTRPHINTPSQLHKR